MLSTIIAKRNALMAKFSKVNVNEIQDAELRGKAKTLKAKQGGFTLLELLVVVAILAAIAGTATVALQGIDQKAQAAINATKMDELTKGVFTFSVLNKGRMPNYMDSLLVADSADLTKMTDKFPDDNDTGTLDPVTNSIMPMDAAKFVPLLIDDRAVVKMAEAGLTHVMALDPATNAAKCAPAAGALKGSLESVSIYPSTMFLTTGCGVPVDLSGADANKVTAYTGKLEPFLGADAIEWDKTAITTRSGDGVVGDKEFKNNLTAIADGAPVVAVFGLGQDSSLFNTSVLGGLTAAPTFGGLETIQYNRFLAMFQIGTGNTAALADKTSNGRYLPSTVRFIGMMTPKGTAAVEELSKWDI